MGRRTRGRNADLRLLVIALAASGTVSAARGTAAEREGPREPVPPPSETQAEVIVSGRTSTVKSLKIVNVGQQIPENYGSRTKNTSGYTWYVSQHYALKTNLQEKPANELPGAHDILTWLELAYPHYVGLFGREPRDIDRKRMVVVYSRSEKELKKILAADGYGTGVAGGVTYDGTSYQYPSTLYYHQRYISIHECTHLFQRSAPVAGTWHTPLWFFEGIADSMASHVYDEKKRRLTVHVLDKGTKRNFLDAGLRYLRKNPKTARQIHDDYVGEYGDEPRGAWVMLVHFFAYADVDRAATFDLWKDEILERRDAKRLREHSSELLEELFGSWTAIDASFARWVRQCPNTFHQHTWLWEQTGNVYWNRGDYSHGKIMRMDVDLIPAERPSYSPFRMDYPAEPVPSVVGPVRRGVAEPSLGCLLDLSARPRRGQVGFGLGVSDGSLPGEKEGFVSLLIDEGQTLIVDGSALGVRKESAPIPADVRRATAENGHRVGMTARIRTRSLEVTLRAGDARFALSVPLKAAQRRQLMNRPPTLIGGKYNWNGITPYFDDERRPEPDLSVPAPANRWRNPG